MFLVCLLFSTEQRIKLRSAKCLYVCVQPGKHYFLVCTSEVIKYNHNESMLTDWQIECNFRVFSELVFSNVKGNALNLGPRIILAAWNIVSPRHDQYANDDGTLESKQTCPKYSCMEASESSNQSSGANMTDQIEFVQFTFQGLQLTVSKCPVFVCRK